MEYIEVRGARENNLKNVSLRIPKRKITVFPGVSGSGKSSLVFDTIAMEAQRLLSENFSTFLRGFMPKYPQPAADSLANLDMAVVVDQRRLGGGSHSTVGTVTDISSILRLLFSRAGNPTIGGAHLFSFNDPKGMCPECNGLGRKLGVNMKLFLHESKSLNDGALLYPGYAPGEWEWNTLNESHLFDMDKKIGDYSSEVRELLLYGKARKVSLKFGGRAVNLTYEGAIEKFTNKYIKKDLRSYSARTQKTVSRYMSMESCRLCKGARLSPQSLGVTIDAYNIAALQAMEVDQLLEVVRDLEAPSAEPILKTLESRLEHLCDIGLAYLSLDRETDTLSGGKSARVNNLKSISVDIPAGVLTVVTGVAGSGKSSLVHQSFVPQHPDAIVVDQTAIGSNSRSNPATYTGIMDDVRKAFARANKVAASLFSFNSKGACKNCQGLGVVYTDLAYLNEIKLPCEVCGGKRFKEEVLRNRLDGKSIADVLELTVDQALGFFTLKEVRGILEAMRDVDLGYLNLGQPLSTLSGGECQRIKLAGELRKTGSLYVMDEPTTGLHMADIAHLLQIIDRIVDKGNTMIVIEHNLDLIRNADWIIDLGPEGGHRGGTVLFEGMPRDLLRAKGSLTARYLQ